jgi:phosphatidylserine/phosphatidylglycerophosphate/cardiolipin synthase-like enzyme
MSERKHRPRPDPTDGSTAYYFSPNGGCAAAIIAVLNAAQSSVDIAMYSFTNAEIAAAIMAVQSRKVPIRIVFDQSETQGTQATYHDQFEQAGIPIKLYSPPNGILHDKYAIVDLATVINGSFNWTEKAEHDNYENIQIHQDPNLAGAYEANYQVIWGLAQLEVPPSERARVREIRSLAPKPEF